MSISISFSSVIIVLLLIFNSLLTILPGQLQLISMAMSIVIGCFIFVQSIKKVYCGGDIFQPILICNVFLLMFFVLRPIWLVLNADSIHSMSYFKYYILRKGIFEYPVAKAELFGIIGMFFINQGYFSNRKLKEVKEFKHPIDITERSYRSRSLEVTCWLLFGVAMLFWLLYIYRGFVQHGSVSMIYIIWVYILTVTIPIYVAHKGKIDLLIVAILGVSMVSLVALGNRQLIISLLLCTAISQIQFNSNSIKKFGKTMLKLCAIAGGMAIVVVWFASVRYEREFALNSVLESVLGEFGMYDMFVVSLDARSAGYVPRYYYGYYFLNFFSYFLPAIDIVPFDHQLVQDALRGVIGGGVPISVVGSLYMNFGCVGLVGLSFVLGRCFSAVYIKNRKKESLLGDLQNVIFLTFVYDLTRVGDFGRELLVFLVMYSCLRIAFIFINKKQNLVVYNRIHGGGM